MPTTKPIEALLDVAEYARIDMVTTPASEAHRIITRLQQRGVALIAGD
ncbi:MAG: hypothetical protein IPL59_14985 [Candidatus Competibacteraceae bacterium]|nr:hypothetical protein [Candidatus Competibacteraceae bacterium]